MSKEDGEILANADDATNNHKAEEDALYGDLEDAAAAPASSDTSGVKRPVLYDQEHVDKLQHQVNQLRAENQVLKRNMGTLYRTAKAELQRKDTEVSRLYSQLDAAGAATMS
eukprot:scaffold72307_cov51-Attheya_sp.AAC.2